MVEKRKVIEVDILTQSPKYVNMNNLSNVSINVECQQWTEEEFYIYDTFKFWTRIVLTFGVAVVGIGLGVVGLGNSGLLVPSSTNRNYAKYFTL